MPPSQKAGADPLADLRQEDGPDPDLPTVQGNGEESGHAPEPEEEVPNLRPMVTQGLHDEMVREAVVAWHKDPTSLGFLHGGGSVCGCFYIAREALKVAVPVMSDLDQEERELEQGQ